MCGRFGSGRHRCSGFTGGGTRRPYHAAMGFNPFRQQDKTVLDIAIVIGFALVTLAVVAWAFFG